MNNSEYDSALTRSLTSDLCLGHSRSSARASYPSCVSAYPRGSRSRVFCPPISYLPAPIFQRIRRILSAALPSP
jgi:hypothetical protein